MQQDKNKQQEILSAFQSFALQFLDSLSERPVGVQYPLQPFQPLTNNAERKGALHAMQEFQQRFENGITGSAGPRYLGFVTGGANPAALLGDWITSTIDQNACDVLSGSVGQITLETLEQLRKLFALPSSFQGTFVTGATMANFTGMAIGREWLGQQFQKNISEDGIQDFPITILSACAHSSTYKSIAMLGLGRKHLQTLDTIHNREALAIEDLERALKQHKGKPILVVASSGTVNTTDFDDLEAIGNLKKKYSFWFHVDAAFGGFARISSKYQHLTKGLEQADSITIDMHKWMNVPYDCGVVFTKHQTLQNSVFNNSNAPYLENNNAITDFFHLSPENSQRFRALPVWFTLQAYGKQGIEHMVDQCCTLAKQLGEAIQNMESLKLVAPVTLNIVCFALASDNSIEKRDAFLQAINRTGKVFMTPTMVRNTPAIRAAFSNWSTSEKDLEIILHAVKSVSLMH